MPYRRASMPVIVAPVYVNGVQVLRELARKGAYVVAADPDPRAIGFRSRYVKERVVLPPVENHPGALAAFLLARRDLYGGIVIPTDDFYVREIHAHFGDLSRHYRLAVSPGESTAIALDKGRAYEAARRTGLATPKTTGILEASQLEAAAEYTGFPAILRAAFSVAFVAEFHTKNFLVNDLAQLKDRFRKATASGHEMMLQEVIPGPATNLWLYRFYATDSGQLHGFTGNKLCQYPPVFGIGQVSQSWSNSEVERISRTLLQHIAYRGAIGGIEWKYDERDGCWKLIEINARSIMSIGLCKYSGFDLLDMLWRDKQGLPIKPPGRLKEHRRIAYLKNGLLRHRAYPEHRLTLREYWRLYRPPLKLALFDPCDLGPFICDIGPLLWRRLSHK